MKRVIPFAAHALAAIALVSCGTETKEESTDAVKKIVRSSDANGGDDSEYLEDKYANFGKTFEQDDEGHWVVSDEARRSQFEGQNAVGLASGWNGGKSMDSRYSNKAWGGGKDYSKKTFGKNLDSRFNGSEWFLQQQAAGEASKRARAQGQVYGTGDYATGVAREGRVSNIPVESDVETDVRRGVFQAPVKMSPTEAGMTQDQVKSKLGRLAPWSDDGDE